MSISFAPKHVQILLQASFAEECRSQYIVDGVDLYDQLLSALCEFRLLMRYLNRYEAGNRVLSDVRKQHRVVLGKLRPLEGKVE